MVFIDLIPFVKRISLHVIFLSTLWILIKLYLLIQTKYRNAQSSKDKKRKQTNYLLQEVNSLPDEKDADIIIVGSGVVGSALAASLANKGMKVILIDKNFGYSNTIAGEILQPGGIDCLNRLNLSETYKNIDAIETQGYFFTSHRFKSKILLPYKNDPNEKKNQKNALIFHHGRFLSKLRQASDQYENVVKLEGQAHKLLILKDRIIGVNYIDKHNQEPKILYAPITVIAEGHFSKFRPLFVPPGIKPIINSFIFGIIVETPQAIKDANEQEPTFAYGILGAPSFIIIYKVSSIHTRIIMDILPPLPVNLREYVQNIICPQLPEIYKEKVWKAMNDKQYDTEGDINKLKGLPSLYLCAQSRLIPGTILMGDIINMRHPITGAGMTVALKDVIYWTQELGKLYHDHDQQFSISDESLIVKLHHLQKGFIKIRCQSYSFAADVLAQLLAIIYAPGDDEIIQEIQCNCVHYFHLGGFFVRGPMDIVSMNNTSPYLLLLHLLGMLIYGMGRSFWTRIKIKKHWSGYTFIVYDLTRILYTAFKFIVPIIWRETKIIFPFV